MARGIEGNEISTQKKKMDSSSTPKPNSKQQGIAAFFKKKQGPVPTIVTPAKLLSDADDAKNASKASRSSPVNSSGPTSSSPLPQPTASQQSSVDDGRDKENGMKEHRCR